MWAFMFDMILTIFLTTAERLLRWLAAAILDFQLAFLVMIVINVRMHLLLGSLHEC